MTEEKLNYGPGEAHLELIMSDETEWQDVENLRLPDGFGPLIFAMSKRIFDLERRVGELE